MARRPMVDTTNEYLGKESQFNIDEIGSGSPDIEVVDRVLSNDKFEEERFMNEKLSITVHDSTEEVEEPLVYVAVNGINQFIKRGYPQEVRRCFVERLARMKKTTYNQTLDERKGEAEFNRLRSHHALRYPFSVNYDPSPKGPAWLQGILAERT